MSYDLDVALTVPGFTTRRDARRVVFTSDGEPTRTVVWRVTPDQLRRHAHELRHVAREAWGRAGARGEWLLAVHLQEALETFGGTRGELRAAQGGLRVDDLD